MIYTTTASTSSCPHKQLPFGKAKTDDRPDILALIDGALEESTQGDKLDLKPKTEDSESDTKSGIPKGATDTKTEEAINIEQELPNRFQAQYKKIQEGINEQLQTLETEVANATNANTIKSNMDQLEIKVIRRLEEHWNKQLEAELKTEKNPEKIKRILKRGDSILGWATFVRQGVQTEGVSRKTPGGTDLEAIYNKLYAPILDPVLKGHSTYRQMNWKD